MTPLTGIATGFLLGIILMTAIAATGATPVNELSDDCQGAMHYHLEA